ncbi:MAG: glycosyltransferase [Clostridium sp.]|nr:glycosyltransferase [Clostridium sp.]MCM1207422.1 glycosyltransferase [Ruminococcus sp.]
MEKLISVIVPIYNGENCIDRCMETLVNQTIGIDNLEIILVNDASTDNSLDKLKEWEQKFPDSVLVVTYDENLMQGGARNIGVQYASADYIAFVDMDDWLELDAYEVLLKYTDNQRFDVVRGKYVDNINGKDIYHKNGKREDVEYHFKPEANGYYLPNIDKIGNIGEYGSVWSGIYRKSMITDNEIWFPEHMIYDDNYWCCVLNFYVSSLYIVDKVIYHYFRHPDSVFHEEKSLRHLDRLKSELLILDAYKERGLFDLCKEQLEYNFVGRFFIDTLVLIFWRFDTLPKGFDDTFEFMRQKVLELFPDYKKNPEIQQITPPLNELLRLLEIPFKIPLQGLNDVRNAYCDTMREMEELYNFCNFGK